MSGMLVESSLGTEVGNYLVILCHSLYPVYGGKLFLLLPGVSFYNMSTEYSAVDGEGERRGLSWQYQRRMQAFPMGDFAAPAAMLRRLLATHLIGTRGAYEHIHSECRRYHYHRMH